MPHKLYCKTFSEVDLDCCKRKILFGVSTPDVVDLYKDELDGGLGWTSTVFDRGQADSVVPLITEISVSNCFIICFCCSHHVPCYRK